VNVVAELPIEALGAMPVTCPDGHLSVRRDYCDECGARISAASPAQPTELLPAMTTLAERAAVPEPCPACGAARARDDLFCEHCGYDLAKAAAGQAGPSHGCWRLVIAPDREHFDRVAAAGMEFPSGLAPVTLVLEGEEMRLGRAELGGDPAVSRAHASLVRQADGCYAIVDHGSSNGTTLNGDRTLESHVPVPLTAGDRVHLGAWTMITLVAPPEAGTS
jgi:hypothetical protein